MKSIASLCNMKQQRVIFSKTFASFNFISSGMGDSHTPVPINNLLALHKQYTNCPSNLAGYEAENLCNFSDIFPKTVKFLKKGPQKFSPAAGIFS